MLQLFPQGAFAPIALSDFETIEVKTSLSNMTSRHGLGDSAKEKTKANLANRFTLHELDGRTLVLEAPKRFASQGHHLLIDLEIGVPTENHGTRIVRFRSTARISEIESMEESRERLRVELLQYDVRSWEEFLEIFVRRQSEIFDFMSSAKGI